MAAMIDAAGSGGALAAALNWIEGLLYSPITTAFAVLAIAATGFSMLSGRIAVRRGLTVALGCFVLFGAPAIARGIIGSTAAIAGPPPGPEPPPSDRQPGSVFEPPPAPPAVSDPYAGASVR